MELVEMDIVQHLGRNSEDPSCYTIGILGDLHLDPRNMEDSLQGRLSGPQIVKLLFWFVFEGCGVWGEN